MANPYGDVLGRPPRKPKKELTPSHKRAVKQERDTALRVGGRRIVGSGSFDEKGDVRNKGKIRVECKTTKHKSFAVTLEMVRKIEEAALSGAEIPVLLVEFNDNGKPIGEVAVIPAYFLDELCQTINR